MGTNDNELRAPRGARSHAEELQRQREWSEQRYLATFNQAAVGIAVADLEYRLIEANQKFCDILGYPLEELRRLTFTALTHPADQGATQTSVQALLAGKIPNYVLEKRYLRKDGTDVWCRTNVTLLRDFDGRPAQFIGLVEDITDRKKAETISSRLAAIVESSGDAIVSKTLQGVITTWNQGAERMFGYSAAEVIGKSVILLIPPDRQAEEEDILARLRRGERIEHYETVRMRKDGTLLEVSLSVSPIKDFSGTIVGASKIARDISRQKRIEAALRDTDRRKDEFLATLAHELRNPLAPIRQAVLIARSPAATEAQKRWSHNVISRQVDHMALLLDDLLDISRITRGTLELRTEMTELHAIVEAAVETARPVMDAKHHKLSLELPPEPIRFAADPLRLAQVLSNLLTNSAKYTDPGGQIRLRASCAAGILTLAVIDNGIGIPPHALSDVFAMFSQVKSSQDRSEGGLGIGLALARGLVELHGGTLEANSEGIGRGSEFIVRLPLRALTLPRKIAVDSPAAKTPMTRKILIADDNRDAAESLAILLRLEGHEVSVVNDGAEALEAFSTVHPEVMLLDVGMPRLNGYQVAEAIRNKPGGRAVVLVAVTGWGQESDKAQAAAAGFDHHFTKPVDPDRLSELLRKKNPAP